MLNQVSLLDVPRL